MSVEDMNDSPPEHQRLPVFVNLSEKHAVVENRKESIGHLWTPIKEDNTVQHLELSQEEIAELESAPWNAEAVMHMSQPNKPTSSHVTDAQIEISTVQASEFVKKETIVPELDQLDYVTVQDSNQQYERIVTHDVNSGNNDRQSEQTVAPAKPKIEFICTSPMSYPNIYANPHPFSNPYSSTIRNTNLMMFVTPYVRLQPGILDPTLKIHQNPPSVFNGFKFSPELRGRVTNNSFERHKPATFETHRQKPMNNVERLNQHEKDGGKMVVTKCKTCKSPNAKNQKKLQDVRQFIPEISQESIRFVLATATPLWNPYNPFMYNPELFRFVLPIVPIQPPICSSNAYNQISYIAKVFNVQKPNFTNQRERFDPNSSLHNYILQLLFGNHYPPGYVEEFYIFSE